MPLERAPPGAHALDRDDLGLDREDRLDPQRRADPRLRAADPPAAAQELERVDGEQDLQLARARRARARPRPRASAPAADGVGGGDRHQAVPGAARRASRRTSIRSGATPRSTSWSRACSAERTVPEIPPDRWIERMSLPALEQRLVDREEVADRRLRRASAARAPSAGGRRTRRSPAGRPRGRRAAGRPSARRARRCGGRGARRPRAACSASSR